MLNMKKKNLFKKIAISFIAVMMLSTCVFSANAVSSDRTETYYMDGQKIYGQVTLYPTHASGVTYCELESAGKALKVFHKYKNENGDNLMVSKGDFTYVYNNINTLTRSTTQAPADFYINRGAVGKHLVKTRVGMEWDSRDVSDNSVV